MAAIAADIDKFISVIHKDNFPGHFRRLSA